MATLGKTFCQTRALLRLIKSNLNNSLTKDQFVCRYHRSLSGKLKDLYNRRIEQGPEPERPRSAWANWNYNAEVYSFGKRLGEDFTDASLKRAFTQRSYIESEASKREELGMTGEDMVLADNEELAQKGERLAHDYISAYLRHSLPHLPEDGVSCLTGHLLSDNVLSHVARHLGVKDLVLTAEFPVSESSLTTCLKAVIGALVEDSGTERAHAFVLDFIITQLIGRTLDEIWKVADPMGLLVAIHRTAGRAEPTPRLIWEAGSETLMAAYLVGIYEDKQLVGKAAGETVTIAQEMAARDCLRNYFGLTDHRTPFKFGAEGQSLALDFTKKNPSLQQMSGVAQLS